MTKYEELREKIRLQLESIYGFGKEWRKDMLIDSALNKILSIIAERCYFKRREKTLIIQYLPVCPLEPGAWADVYKQAQQDMLDTDWRPVKEIKKDK